MIFKVNGIHHEVDFPVLKLQFLGAQHIHASRGIWEARDSSVIQNVLCLGFDGPIQKSLGRWWIWDIDVYCQKLSIYIFSFLLLFLRGAKTWRGTKIFLRASETQRGTGTMADGSTWIKDGYEFNIIQSNSRQTVHIDSSCDMSCTSLC